MINLDAIRARADAAEGTSYAWNVVDASQNDVPALLAEVERLESVVDAMEENGHPLIIKQGDLLTGVANALHGEPPELTIWSHHDLPEVASAMVAKNERHRAEVQQMKDYGDRACHKANTERFAKRDVEAERDRLRAALDAVQALVDGATPVGAQMPDGLDAWEKGRWTQSRDIAQFIRAALALAHDTKEDD